MCNIRSETPADKDAIARVNRLAFGQDTEANLVADLRDGGFVRVSLVAEVENELVGHILFSRLPIVSKHGIVEALSLAPMAVVPLRQRRGIGGRLIEEGLGVCRAEGHGIVVVLGHPTYYPRFGFSAELAEPLVSPFGGGEAWMAIELIPGALSGVAGTVEYPPPFAAVS